jgi:hypothetical protein
MIRPERCKTLIKTAEALAGKLSRSSSPSGDPIDPSRLAELTRCLMATRDVEQTRRLAKRLPASPQAAMTRSAAPEFRDIERNVGPILEQFADVDELLYVLGWTQRLMRTAERAGSPSGGRRPPRR